VKSFLGAAAAISPRALHGIENPADIAMQVLDPGILLLNPGVLLFDPGILLFHPGKHLTNFPAVLFQRLRLPELDLGQLHEESSDSSNFSPEIPNLGTDLHKVAGHFGKPGRGPIHVIPQDLGQPPQGQATIRLSHTTPLVFARSARKNQV
jgi:hypothetical protein